ncbi:Anti-sigma-I factor RsgI6 [Bulinus truncatus]|nr:Anti-sigma-I factor RsgI6 [Bulinus truncatus]
MFKTYLCIVLLWFHATNGAPELIQNPGFENGIDHWVHDGFTMVSEAGHAHGGNTAAKCTGRTQTWHGPAQFITVQQGARYAFSAYIHLINDIQGTEYQRAMVKVNCKWNDNGTAEYLPVTSRPFLTSALGWVPLVGDFIVPNREYISARIYLEGLAPHVDYYLDDTSLTEIPENTAWKAEADHRIDTLRKSNIHINAHVASNFNANDLTIQIDHTKHRFGFGSMLNADYIINPDYKQFQNIAYHMFNWATIQEYKWTFNRGTRADPDYSVALAATDELRKHGLSVRGHCMFWAVPGNHPSWVAPMTGQTLKDAVDEHIRYMTGLTKGKLEHWDVNNELLHGHFFESHTGDPLYSRHMFQAVHATDPHPKLFLNDFNVVALGEHTLAYLEQIQQFQAANVGLGAVGVQSHFHKYTEPDPTLLKQRLDILAKAGLPIWITELDLHAQDETTRADWYERVLRLYFSHPSIEGIIFWGFWDHGMDPEMALVHGYSFMLDKAGQRYLQLTKQEWSTHVNRSLAMGTSFNVRGFQGDYELTVWYKNKPIKRQTFTLGKPDTTVNVDISGDGHEIQLPVKPNPLAHVAVAHSTTSTGLKTEGRATSTSTAHQLTCATRWSAVSELGDDKIAENNDWHRDGEQIVMTNGRPVCKATNGFRTTEAGPSGTGIDDQVVVPCGSDGYPLGCGTHSYLSDSDGSYFTNSTCVSQNDGVTVGGTIKCTTVQSPPSGHAVGARATIQCPAGQVMTGCNVYSPNAKAAGAFIQATNNVDHCVAVNGLERFGSEAGVQAYATYCQL